MRWWAFWRRVMYGGGALLLASLCGVLVYTLYFYESAHCFDGIKNGDEVGVDCDGGCVRMCTATVLQPEVQWARSFRAVEGMYNAVAYVENQNVLAGVARLRYTMKLYDGTGLITERNGETELPPGQLHPIFEGRIDTKGRTPTQTVIEFEPDPVWVSASLAPVSYRVESRTLTGADDAPVLTARIRNESLEEAKDVEVVTTIFDRQGTALTASRTKVPLFLPRSVVDVVFTWPEPIAKTIRSCEVPTDVVMAIDLSGSMNDDGGTPPEPVSSVLIAARAFVERLGKNDQVGLVTFATDAVLNDVLTSDRTALAERIAALLIAPESERGSTNTGDAFLRAYEELGSPRHNDDARKVLVLLTDGLPTAPEEDPEAHAVAMAHQVKEAGIEVFTIGLGEKLNEPLMRTLATDPAHYFHAPDVATIGRIYESVTAALCEEGAAKIEIIPKRSGVYAPLRPTAR